MVINMKYENAIDIFPEQLLRQIQKYVSGKLVYIPKTETRREWGETSGYKKYLLERNQEIKEKFGLGTGIEQLAEEYCLSCETIKRIVYSKKEVFLMEYNCTLTSAKDYAKNKKLQDWVHTYLLSDGHNKDFSDGLKLFDRYYLGPMKMPLSLFERCCGPEENMKYRVDPVWFEKHVNELKDIIQREKDMPPMIVHFMDGAFELNDGNHRFEAYQRLNIKEYYFIVWITEKKELDLFLEQYSKYLPEDIPGYSKG